MRLGVTGGMGCGKTTLCTKVVEYARRQGTGITLTDADDVRRDILGTNPRHIFTRAQLTAAFGLATNGNGIDRRALSAIIFGDDVALAKYERLTDEPIRAEINHRLSTPGHHVLDWALIVEKNALALVNYNVVLVTCDPAVQHTRIFGHDLPDEQVRARLAHQYSQTERRLRVYNECALARGTVLEVDTTNGIPEDAVQGIVRIMEAGR